MTRLLIVLLALATLPASAQEITGTGQFVPILDEEHEILWVVDTENGEVKACRLADMTGNGIPIITCSSSK